MNASTFDRCAWKRELWGVEFRGVDRKKMLLGSLWHSVRPTPYYDEPAHALLFMTRSAARAWCRNQMNISKGRTDYYGQWKFRAIKVVETVRPA